MGAVDKICGYSSAAILDISSPLLSVSLSHGKFGLEDNIQ